MTMKIRRPKVNIPSYVKVSAMLSSSCKGRIDRGYIKSMTVALSEFDRKRSDSSKKFHKDLSSDD